MTRRNRSRIGSRWTGAALCLTLGWVLRAMPAGAAAPSAVPPGEYIYEGGRGSLKVKGSPGQAQTFSIDTVGGNGHTCSLEGDLKGLEGHVADEDHPPEPCTLSLELSGANAVEVSGSDACRGFCGMRATFEGKYILPTPECRPAAVTATRAKFKKRYDAKDYAGARELLAGLLKSCTPVIDAFDVMWIRNDLAIAQHHAGDDAGCRATLQPLEHLAKEDPDDVGAGEPAVADDLKKIAKATRTNLALCAASKTQKE